MERIKLEAEIDAALNPTVVFFRGHEPSIDAHVLAKSLGQRGGDLNLGRFIDLEASDAHRDIVDVQLRGLFDGSIDIVDATLSDANFLDGEAYGELLPLRRRGGAGGSQA